MTADDAALYAGRDGEVTACTPNSLFGRVMECVQLEVAFSVHDHHIGREGAIPGQAARGNEGEGGEWASESFGCRVDVSENGKVVIQSDVLRRVSVISGAPQIWYCSAGEEDRFPIPVPADTPAPVQGIVAVHERFPCPLEFPVVDMVTELSLAIVHRSSVSSWGAMISQKRTYAASRPSEASTPRRVAENSIAT